jgi:hypothetical protein
MIPNTPNNPHKLAICNHISNSLELGGEKNRLVEDVLAIKRQHLCVENGKEVHTGNMGIVL